jgi:nucleoside-diphosphate-sugar epimerase
METFTSDWMVIKVVGFDGEVVFDPGKTDGTPRKLLDVSKLSGMGWRPRVKLEGGIGMAYGDFLQTWLEVGALVRGCEGSGS